ncbi:MAG: hypothetical protein IJI38_11325 [Clostridia bacterium]|nr:hypothetical protein [Clostridia bacterium]
MNTENRFDMENTENQDMQVAVNSLVHFTEGTSSFFRENLEDDGLTALQIARTAYLCMAC